MQRTRRLLWIIVLLFAILILVTSFHFKAKQSWQEQYLQRASEGIVNLLQTNPYDQTPVVVIVIDGLRWEEGFGAEDKYIPHIWNDLRPLGTILTNFRIASPTATTSAHTAMVTGRISTVPNDGHIGPVFPTFLEHYRDVRAEYVESALEEILVPNAGFFRLDADAAAEIDRLTGEAREMPPEKTALYLGKDLIYSLVQSSSGRYPAEDVYVVDAMRDIEVFEYFRAKIPDVTPHIAFVNLGDVDEAGHEVEWFYYVDTIRWADRLVWEMWLVLQELKRYRDKTLFIVTTDHGRHIPARGGYPHHGCFCEGCQHSFALLIGPGIKAGYVSDEPHTELDLAPTIARALGFTMPAATGEPIMEAFADPDSLPEPLETQTSALVREDVRRVDERETPRILLETLAEQSPEGGWGNNIETALLILSVAEFVKANPDQADRWAGFVNTIAPADDDIAELNDILLGYPMIELGRALEGAGNSWGNRFVSRARDEFGRVVTNGFLDQTDPALPETTAATAMIAAFTAAIGDLDDAPRITRLAYRMMLDALAEYEGEERVYGLGLDALIEDCRYRGGPNVMFLEDEPAIRDRMWLLWGAERVIAEGNPSHVPDLHPLLRQQYRLMVAFTHEWQDANAMVGGTGDLGEAVDLTAQGLCLAALADFEPWRRWELDELGYSPTIYATPLFHWPLEHFFYLLGQANGLAGAWAADERLRLHVNDDGTIRRDLLDRGTPFAPSDPEYASVAASLAYGLIRFESADYESFDLEIYPIVDP